MKGTNLVCKEKRWLSITLYEQLTVKQKHNKEPLYIAHDTGYFL